MKVKSQLALASLLYALPGIGSALAISTIRYMPKPPEHTDIFERHLCAIWEGLRTELELIAACRIVAYTIGYGILSDKTDDTTLLLTDLAGYGVPFFIEFSYKGINRLRELYRARFG